MEGRAEEGELLRRPSAVVIIKLIICLRVPRGNYNSDFGHLPDVDAVAIAIAFTDCDADADANEDANVDDDDVHEWLWVDASQVVINLKANIAPMWLPPCVFVCLSVCGLMCESFEKLLGIFVLPLNAPLCTRMFPHCQNYAKLALNTWNFLPKKLSLARASGNFSRGPFN